ncbi:MAG: biphenyl 2,3-dioxygenase [Proteobacteria bacterium]|nr:biphenyl 2,3-dioxygenase [Pseudomonadota bacterium]|tara:strand:+ start:76 stop:546 length:471 start_codon:yes stop_codon:yes gene_type:complete
MNVSKQHNFLWIAFFLLFHNTYAAGDLTRQDPIEIKIDMRSNVESHFFSPSLIRLETGNLYKIVLKNNSDVKHYFSSPRFSKVVFTRKVQVLKDGERIAEIKGSISDVEVFPMSIVEWWLVPIKTGEFNDLHCYVKDKKTGKTHSEMGMVGTIIVY